VAPQRQPHHLIVVLASILNLRSCGHINHLGPSSHFDGTHFYFWKFSIQSHLRNCSEELWDMVFRGYKPVNPTSLYPHERYDHQLNGMACDRIQRDVHRSLRDQIFNLESVKELWERIMILQEGTSLIQKKV
jgi:hypothetical protein